MKAELFHKITLDFNNVLALALTLALTLTLTLFTLLLVPSNCLSLTRVLTCKHSFVPEVNNAYPATLEITPPR